MVSMVRYPIRVAWVEGQEISCTISATSTDFDPVETHVLSLFGAYLHITGLFCLSQALARFIASSAARGSLEK